MGYAVAYHMLSDYDMAIKVMGEYRKTQNVAQVSILYYYNSFLAKIVVTVNVRLSDLDVLLQIMVSLYVLYGDVICLKAEYVAWITCPKCLVM